MKVSRADAFSVLQKWNAERTPVFGILLLDNDLSLSVRVSGFITAFEPDLFISEFPTPPISIRDKAPKNHIMVPHRFMQSFEYGEGKDDPLMAGVKDNPHFTRSREFALLTIQFINGAVLRITAPPDASSA